MFLSEYIREELWVVRTVNGTCTAYTIYGSPVGALTLAGAGDSLTGMWFHGQKHFGSTLPSGARREVLPVLRLAAKWLDEYFSGREPGFMPPLSPAGSEFRQQVWALLTEIPYGEVVTYGRLAGLLEERTGRRSSARAVGGAVGHNPISIFIPCHRVTGADGSLTGYAGGTERKAALLRLEGVCGKFRCEGNPEFSGL